MTKKEKVNEVIRRLSKIYQDPMTELVHTSPFELLVATILSAQATDKVVNQVTPALFLKLTTPWDFANSSVEEIESFIMKVNFHHNKAISIYKASKVIVEKYKGEVPDSMDELTTLPGVARKTANVVLGDAFGKSEGIAVDTHVIRLARRLGLTDEVDREKIEKDLMRIVPKKYWITFSHLLILTGREYCPARGKGRKGPCPLEDLFIY